MKRLFQLFLILPFVLVACHKTSTPIENEEVCVVKIGWSGELDLTYEPMTKASADDLYGIQVYAISETAEGVTEKPYAYGVFDDPVITISLIKGTKYKFVAQMVRNGKNELSIMNGGSGTHYHYPFCTWGDPISVSSTNSFQYRADDYIYSLGGGRVMMDIGNGESVAYDVSKVDTYYGELDNYDPKQSNNATISMVRASFGVKVKVEEDCGGTLDVMIDGARKLTMTLSEDQNEMSAIFTYPNVREVWSHTQGVYSQVIETSFSWNKEDGTVVPLGAHDITYKRNQMSVITLELTDGTVASGIGFQIDESGEMPDGEEILINNEEVSDTDINVTLPDFILNGVNKGKGVLIDGLIWAPVNAGDYISWYTAGSSSCPEGWRLPTYQEFASLAQNKSSFSSGYYFSGSTAYDGSASSVYMSAKGRERYGDDEDDDIIYYEGTKGYYWSSTSSGGSGCRVFVFSASGVTYEDLSAFDYGCSVRCVMDL